MYYISYMILFGKIKLMGTTAVYVYDIVTICIRQYTVYVVYYNPYSSGLILKIICTFFRFNKRMDF